MQILRSKSLKVKNVKKKSIVTIGNFDGMHLGHQHILKQLSNKAKQYSLSSTVIIFEPQPSEFFNSDTKRIMSLREKIIIFKEYNIDRIICFNFNKVIANSSPQDFINFTLISSLKTKIILVGDDFFFGNKRSGNIKSLSNYKNDFKVIKINPFPARENRISSSKIREYLSKGQFVQASRSMGRDYTISGKVIHGKRNGTKIAYPTANIRVPQNIVLRGAYIVKIFIGNQFHEGIANIGKNPTIDNKKIILEVHIFDFFSEIYKEYVTIKFLKFIRTEKKFRNLVELKNQLFKDKELAISWLKSNIKKN